MFAASSNTPNITLQHCVFLGLGSNLGAREANLRAAVGALAPLVEVTRISSLYDTAPQLFEDQPRFLNVVAQGMTDLDPFALLATLKHTETTLGRTPSTRYGPRAIDLDLLLYDTLVLNTPSLTIPHPRMTERAFVLAPLAEIAPHLVHPVLGSAISALAQRVTTQDVKRLGPLLTAGG